MLCLNCAMPIPEDRKGKFCSDKCDSKYEDFLYEDYNDNIGEETE